MAWFAKKKPRVARRGAGLFAALALVLSCSFEAPVSYWSGTEGALYALSRNAEQGRLPLGSAGKLEYRLESPIPANSGYSLEVDFIREGEAGAAGSAVLEAGGLVWELPFEFSFLDGADIPLETGAADTVILLSYAVPLVSDLDTITFSSVPAKTAKGNAALVINALRLVPRRLGFRAANNVLSLTPFVYARGPGVVLDPPPDMEFNGDLAVELESGGAVTIEVSGDNALTSQGVVEGRAAKTLILPAAFIPRQTWPVYVRGEGLSAAEISVPAAGLSRAPIPADPGLILSWPFEAFRDPRYELFSWENFPTILVFDFSDYGVQDRFLKRLAFFTEKAGFRGRLAPEREIADLHGWNAHDYRAATLAAFFDLARQTGFPLLPEEKELEAIVLAAGIIVEDGGRFVPGEGAVISISRESVEYLRSLFMAHEGFHGLYFIDAAFRDFCRRRWEGFAAAPKAFILSYFGYQAYDTNDTDLVINEFMAHILQQPVSGAARYFGETLARRIDASERRRGVLPPMDEETETWPDLAKAFTAEAEAFSRYVNERWGLAAGRVRKITVR